VTNIRHIARAGLRYVGATGTLIIWHPSKRYSSKYFCLRQAQPKMLRARCQIADNFRRSSFACGNLGVPALMSDYSSDVLASLIDWGTQAAAWLAHPLDRPCGQDPDSNNVDFHGINNYYFTIKD
jgi:hypothetical protein